MTYQTEFVTAATEDPVTLTEAKRQLRITYDDEDDHISSLISAATNHLERILGFSFMASTWRVYFDEFAAYLEIPLPVASVTSVKWTDSEGVESTVSSDDYDLIVSSSGQPSVRFKTAYSASTDLAENKAVSITFVSGVATTDEVPPSIKHAIKMLVSHWYSNRDAVEYVSSGDFEELPLGVRALIANYWQPHV